MHASFCVIKGPNSISFAKVLLCLMNSHDFLGSGIINSSEILEGLFKKKKCVAKGFTHPANDRHEAGA